MLVALGVIAVTVLISVSTALPMNHAFEISTTDGRAFSRMVSEYFTSKSNMVSRFTHPKLL
jgi:hypothetical protein